MKKLREFTKTDWFGYLGAEFFNDGSRPQIVEWVEGDTDTSAPIEVTVVADKNQILVIFDDDYDEYTFTLITGNLPKKLTIYLAELIIQDTENIGTKIRDFVTYYREHYPEMIESHKWSM